MQSEYFKSLLLENPDVGERYQSKLKLINDVDPFTLNIYDLDNSIHGVPPITNMDIVSYLVLTHSFYTKEQMKNYKSLQSYKYFESGFVINVGTKVVNDFYIIVGKEKNSFLNYNVSCILTLPPYQRQGYGRLLIDFSYLLTRVEGKIGSPEKPLSDLGLISYRSYWKDVLLGYLCSRAGTQLSVKDISQEMAIHSYDIVSTLQALGMMKYWKGKHIILKKQDVLDEYVVRVKRRGSLLKEVDPSCLRWTPPQPASV